MVCPCAISWCVNRGAISAVRARRCPPELRIVNWSSTPTAKQATEPECGPSSNDGPT